jgi:DICT domain-containing protein
MTNQVLETFYHRMLPLYRPQAEKFITTVEPAAWNRVSFRYTFSVEAMTHISHIIEDAVVNTPRAAVLHASFQYLSRLRPQQARYRRLADTALGMWLYGINDTADPDIASLPRTTFIDTAETNLVRYWFVVAYGAGIGMSLLAEEVPSLTGEDRYYEGFYTFEPDVAYQIIQVLHQTYPTLVPKPLSSEELRER